MKDFKAPWGTALTIISALVTLLCVGIAVWLWTPISIAHRYSWPGILPIVLLFGSALFCIRGYELAPGALLIRRLFWIDRVPLADLQSAEFQPKVMNGSIRTFGNGGLFSFTGRYRNSALGSYRAYVTDFAKTVVLRFPDRTVVVSPEPPEEFVREVLSSAGKR